MQVKNIGARGWHIGDKLIAPLETVELSDDFYNDVKDNPELDVSKGEKKLTKKEQAALDAANKADNTEPVIEADKDAE